MSDRHMNKLSSPKEQLLKLWDRFWHLPDNFYWMEPLPKVHRRWIMLLLIMIILLLLLPSTKPTIAEPEAKAVSSPSQGVLVIDGYQSFDNSTTLPVKIINGKPQTENDEQGVWQELRVQQGQSLTQLFREHNLPVEDALALSKVEGSDKPISNLKAGQQINIKRDNKGKIVAFNIETSGQGQAFFIRQPNGAFDRYQ